MRGNLVDFFENFVKTHYSKISSKHITQNFSSKHCVEKSPGINFKFEIKFENKLTMDENTNSGLCDEIVDKFGEFMKMIEENLYLSEIDIQCAICLNLLQR